MKALRLLKQIMEDENVNKKDLAKNIGISPRAMYDKLNGITDLRLQEEAKPIADYFGTTIDDLFFNDEISVLDILKRKNATK